MKVTMAAARQGAVVGGEKNKPSKQKRGGSSRGKETRLSFNKKCERRKRESGSLIGVNVKKRTEKEEVGNSGVTPGGVKTSPFLGGSKKRTPRRTAFPSAVGCRY